MKEEFRSFNFRPNTLAMIEKANSIIGEYNQKLTLRQIYYQFVSRALIENTERSYKNLGSIVNDGRLAGMIDWEAIEDRNREPVIWAEYDTIKELVETELQNFRLPRWRGQENYVELWVEKAALAGVLRPIAARYHVTLMVNRGYSSQSAMYDSAQRFMECCRAEDERKQPILFYLGDHDPSGEDMVRDIRDRLEMFGVEGIDVQKLALTMEQVRQFRPPPNPAKVTDSRARAYIAKYGNSSWEVDALNPRELNRILDNAFKGVIDTEKMDKVKAEEQRQQRKLNDAVEKILAETEDDDE